MSLEFRLGLDIYSLEPSYVPPNGTSWLTFDSCVRQDAGGSDSPQGQIGDLHLLLPGLL